MADTKKPSARWRRDDGDVGADGGKLAASDAADREKILDAAKRAAVVAKLNDSLRGFWTDAGQLGKLRGSSGI